MTDILAIWITIQLAIISMAGHDILKDYVQEGCQEGSTLTEREVPFVMYFLPLLYFAEDIKDPDCTTNANVESEHRDHHEG